MNTYSIKGLGGILLMVAFSCSAPAFTFRQVGVDSNFLIDDGRVLFTQSDGSLTALNFETGKVLHRGKGHDFSGTLRRIDSGVVVLNYGTITLLNPTNLSVVWETSTHYCPNIVGNALVSYDGNGLVECRNLANGVVRWSFNLPGALDVVAISNKVVVHRAALYDEKTIPLTVLLDLETGKELFRKSPPSGTLWKEVFFDGEKIYLRSEQMFGPLTVWNTQGEEIAKISLKSDEGKAIRWSDSFFEAEQKIFYQGRIYPNRKAIPNEQERSGRLSAVREGTNETTLLVHDLSDGFNLVEHNCPDETLDIEVQSPQGQWAGKIPYFKQRGLISVIALARGKLFLGSNLGHVECINATNGESLWLYVFPTIRHAMSYSSHGMPPMFSKSAAIFRKENQNPPTAGLQLRGQSLRPTHVILDPEPFNPYRGLPRLLIIAWTGALLPILTLVFLRCYHRTRSWDLGIIAMGLLALTFVCFMTFGRVSLGSSIALRIALIIGIVFGCVSAVRHIRQGKWSTGILFFSFCGIVVLLIFPALLSV